MPKNRPGKIEDELSKLLPNLTDADLADLISRSDGWRTVIEPYLPKVEDDSFPADPVEFINKKLGYQVWEKQRDIIKSVEHNKNTIVESGHSTGKSFLSSALACWWFATKQRPVIVTLAPSYNQVQNILWRYMRDMARKHGLPGDILDTTRWNMPSEPNHYAVGLSPKRNTQEDIASMQGYHSENLLVIMDEAAGMPRVMYDAIFNLATAQGNRVLAIGNPIARSGPFWDACNSPTWHHIQISCLEHPNVITGKSIIPGAVSRDWVIEMIKDHCTPCEDNMMGALEFEGIWYLPDPVFQSRVLGVAPQESDDQLIPAGWIVTAQQMELTAEGETVIGLDPARTGGDDSTMLCRKGKKILWIKRRRPMSRDISGEIAGWLKNEIVSSEANRAFVDEIGAGAGVVDACRRDGLPVIGVNVSRPAQKKSRFANIRAEAYWRIREALRKMVLQLPEGDELLSADLIAQKYFFDHLGRIQIEDKDVIRRRIGRSPDSSDALSMTFAYSDSTIEGLDDIEDIQIPSQLVSESRWTMTEKMSGIGSVAGSRWHVGGGAGVRRRGR